MGRREIEFERLAKLRTDVRYLSKYPHLSEIAQRLLGVLDDVSVPTIPNKDINRLIKYVETILPFFPQPEGDNNRFFFDAHMIASFRKMFDKTSMGLSRMILPTCGKEWSYRPVYLPSLDRTKVPRVDLISFKGETQLDDIVLLDYPWLYHELGHILLYEYCELFRALFTRVLDKVVKGLKARSLGDSAINKNRAESTIEKLKRYWEVEDKSWSWAKEIGSDIIALWTCGPSFLTAFDNELDKREPNPYIIDQHPPYEIRSIGLVQASSKLGWSKYTTSLKDRVKLWKVSQFRNYRTNEYLSYTNREILDGAISSTLDMCTDLKIPVCDQDRIQAISKLVQDKATLDFGTELIIAAWLINQKLGSEYYLWERKIVERLNKSIKL